MALGFSGDRKGYRTELKQAVELDPSDADFHIQYAASELPFNVDQAVASAKLGLLLSRRDPSLRHPALITLGAGWGKE